MTAIHSMIERLAEESAHTGYVVLTEEWITDMEATFVRPSPSSKETITYMVKRVGAHIRNE